MNRGFAQAMLIAVAAYERAALGAPSSRSPRRKMLKDEDGQIPPRRFQPATDMTAALIESVAMARGSVSPPAWQWNLSAWYENYPKAADPISRRVLSALRQGEYWFDAALLDLYRYDSCTGHDPLLRNGIIPALRDSKDEIFFFSWLHTARTHWSPMNVLCSALHGWIIHHLAAARSPFSDGDEWLHRFIKRWLRWADAEQDPLFRFWYRHPMIRQSLTYHIRRLLKAEFDPERVEPETLAPCDTRRNVLRALQHAVWFTRIALEYKASRKDDPNCYWRAAGTRARAIHTIARLGSPAAAMAAIAGPMIASATASQLPTHVLQDLSVFDSRFLFRKRDKMDWMEWLLPGGRGQR